MIPTWMIEELERRRQERERHERPQLHIEQLVPPRTDGESTPAPAGSVVIVIDYDV